MDAPSEPPGGPADPTMRTRAGSHDGRAKMSTRKSTQPKKVSGRVALLPHARASKLFAFVFARACQVWRGSKLCDFALMATHLLERTRCVLRARLPRACCASRGSRPPASMPPQIDKARLVGRHVRLAVDALPVAAGRVRAARPRPARAHAHRRRARRRRRRRRQQPAAGRWPPLLHLPVALSIRTRLELARPLAHPWPRSL